VAGNLAANYFIGNYRLMAKKPVGGHVVGRAGEDLLGGETSPAASWNRVFTWADKNHRVPQLTVSVIATGSPKTPSLSSAWASSV